MKRIVLTVAVLALTLTSAQAQTGGKADLTITSAKALGVAGSAVQVVVKNIGQVGTSSYKIAVTVTQGGVKKGTFTLLAPPLPRGQSRTLLIPTRRVLLTSGSRVSVFVDSDNTVVESNENNNRRTFTVR